MICMFAINHVFYTEIPFGNQHEHTISDKST